MEWTKEQLEKDESGNTAYKSYLEEDLEQKEQEDKDQDQEEEE